MWKLLVAVLVLLGLAALYLWAAATWTYSDGERAGYVQKFSRKGWICKTWEGELAMVSMPGTAQEKFAFTVHDPAIAEQINKSMGQRVAVHYEQKVGIPTDCLGETPYWVNHLSVVPDIQFPPGALVPAPQAPATAPMSPAPAQQLPAPPPPAPMSPAPVQPQTPPAASK